MLRMPQSAYPAFVYASCRIKIFASSGIRQKTAIMARRVMSLMLLAAAVAALCRSTAFLAAPKDLPRADVLAALAPMVLGA